MKFKIYVTSQFQDVFLSNIQCHSEDRSFCSEKAAQKALNKAQKGWTHAAYGIIYFIKKTEK